MERKITVIGTGQASVPPDIIGLNLTVTTMKYRYDDTLERAAIASNELKDIVLENNFEADDLKTRSFQVDTKYRRYKDKNEEYKSEFIGYECIQRFELEFPINLQRLSKILVALSAADAKPQFNIYFTVDDQEAVKELVLVDATKKAYRRAEILATGVGAKLGDILRIDYSWSEVHFRSDTNYDLYDTASPRMMSAEATPAITPVDIEASDNVTFVWEIIPQK